MPLAVLLLCARNDVRSILAEAMLRDRSRGRVVAHSAAAIAADGVHPLVLETLARRGHATGGLRSEGLEAFTGPDAPSLDAIVTLGEDIEAPAGLPGAPVTAVWPLPDPAIDPAVAPGPDATRAAFARSYDALSVRIDALLALPLETIDAPALRARLREIGRSGGASA